MKAAAFVQAVLGEVGHGYWYGTYVGHTGTEALLASKAKQYPAQYTAEYIQRSRRWLGVPVCDCVGLIKGLVWRHDFGGRYQAASDLSANGMYNACKVKGPISTIPEKSGVLVWKDRHVGVYIGNGVVVESRGVDYGVVKTMLKDRPWTNWGECHLVDYAVDPVLQRAIDAEAKVARLTEEAHACQAMVSAQAEQLKKLQAEIADDRQDMDDLKLAMRKVAAWIEL